jgi:phospholipase C
MATVTSLLQEEGQFFAGLDNSSTGFFTACKRGVLSNYCFLEPRYSSREGELGLLPQNDQHPDADVRAGDDLIRRVYEAIRANEDIWKKCVFIITWDEHGGLYDHVVPEPATPPGDKSSEVPAFDFSRYGVRVPAVVVSPYIAKGKIDNTIFDHTSLPATAAELLMKRRLLPSELWARTAQANSVSSCFDPGLVANGPRTDLVKIPAMAGTVPAPTPQPLNDLQEEHLHQAIALEKRLPAGAQTGIDPSTLTNDVAADQYIARVFQAAIENGIADQAIGGGQGGR